MYSPTCFCVMSLIINFIPAFIVSASMINAFFTRGKGEKGMTEDEMVGWHHRLSGHEFE